MKLELQLQSLGAQVLYTLQLEDDLLLALPLQLAGLHLGLEQPVLVASRELADLEGVVEHGIPHQQQHHYGPGQVWIHEQDLPYLGQHVLADDPIHQHRSDASMMHEGTTARTTDHAGVRTGAVPSASSVPTVVLGATVYRDAFVGASIDYAIHTQPDILILDVTRLRHGVSGGYIEAHSEAHDKEGEQIE